MNINLTVLGHILYIIGCLCSIWVYIDASGHKIGNTPEGGYLSISAAWWAILSFILWIVVFPIYLIKRQKLIDLAKQYPVEPKARNLKIGLFSLVAIFLIFFK
ncbi:MAG: hypothetical protein ACN6NX_11655 [Acinetobacter sp.]